MYPCTKSFWSGLRPPEALLAVHGVLEGGSLLGRLVDYHLDPARIRVLHLHISGIQEHDDGAGEVHRVDTRRPARPRQRRVGRDVVDDGSIAAPARRRVPVVSAPHLQLPVEGLLEAFFLVLRDLELLGPREARAPPPHRVRELRRAVRLLTPPRLTRGRPAGVERGRVEREREHVANQARRWSLLDAARRVPGPIPGSRVGVRADLDADRPLLFPGVSPRCNI
mmetsp:Transcript_66888/g.153410  ORF Transcript_66888/g.153410 Transcript_66888/m.153410 type:complete len:224 (+) Transcript_66888:33-704(+)